MLTRYTELVVGKNVSVVSLDEYESERVEEDKQLIFDYTDEMRTKIDEYGDANGDGIISAIDTTYFLKAYYNGKEKGDVNTDGTVDARDSSDILSFYANNSVSIQSDYVTEQNMYHLGDINGDGNIDSTDASSALAEYSKNATI